MTSQPGAPGSNAHAIRLRSAVPTFLVPDVAGTARWYVEKLGFTLAGHFPEREPYLYASLQCGGAEIMLLSISNYRKPDLTALRPAGLWDAYIRTDGVRALYARLANEAFIRTPLQRRPYRDWEFEVLDPDGYILVFGGDGDVEEGGAP